MMLLPHTEGVGTHLPAALHIPGIPPTVHGTAGGLKLQVMVQHEAAVPLTASSSHCSVPCVIPFPHAGGGGSMQVSVKPSQTPVGQGVPRVWYVHESVQHEADVPLAAPSSHCSPVASTVPSPHGLPT